MKAVKVRITFVLDDGGTDEQPGYLFGDSTLLVTYPDAWNWFTVRNRRLADSLTADNQLTVVAEDDYAVVEVPVLDGADPLQLADMNAVDYMTAVSRAATNDIHGHND
ncbi:hypothetical protein [Indiicoccus explosivorum]|uniref:hypothetical protein n=1 Tax=Indiicoccus explosivorum TaxID=1917864 RepID=UPI000B433C0C|nr:hypothetical protein [Indiicoccus explosivorum]